MSACSSACGWCGACSAGYDRDEIEGVCLECGAGPDEPHDDDCGCEDDEDALLVTNIEGVDDADL